MNNSDNLNEYGVLILSDRDRIEFDFILENRGADWVRYAVNNLVGNRKPYVSNIAKLAKIDIPANLPDKQKVISIEKGFEILGKFAPKRKKRVETDI